MKRRKQAAEAGPVFRHKTPFQPRREEIASPALIEPTDEEKRNGWTAESLTKYLKDQERAQSERIDPHSEVRRVRPTTANGRYSPFRWRR
jgi:hypothetical protein